MSVTDKVIFYYEPKEFVDSLSSEVKEFQNETLQKLEVCFQQKHIQIKNILITLVRNHHLGNNTYLCKISLISDTPGADFNHEEEGKEYLPIVRSAVNALIHFVMKAKQKDIDEKF